jgi:asparagine synthase (glutamine-hydrolysing)
VCGICGYVGDHRPELLDAMASAMAHRGPDGSGSWFDAEPRVGLGHRRLSIIDLSDAGRQPMCNEDGSVWVSFNGEIYNFQDLRDPLERSGHRFRSNTDSEVLVHLYEERGVEMLHELNGMFAFAIWDAKRRQLLLARDHVGVKPLYYWIDRDRIYFASEIKALLRVPEVPNELNVAAVPHYLTFLWVPGDETMLRGIRKLEPGHYLLWRDGKATVEPWFELRYEPDEGVSERDWIERVHETFVRTTRRQMVSDVPLGAFLSGGLDSSSIVASMREAFPEREITCYTVRFDANDMARDQGADDYPYARRVAEILDVRLKGVLLKPNVIRLLPQMIWHMDEPDADPAIFPSYLICKLAREDGTTVLLSGTGGDEVFFGYRSHVAYRTYEQLRWLARSPGAPALAAAVAASTALLGAQNRTARRLRKFQKGVGQSALERHMALSEWSTVPIRDEILRPDVMAAFPDPLAVPACMRKYFDGFSGRGELNRHSHLLIQTFLAAHNFLYTDKTSMAVSVETRVPFMDVELMRLAARIPEDLKLRGTTTKYVLKKAMERYLPGSVLYRSKTGFGAPLRQWIAEDLHQPIEVLLGRRQLEQRGLFDPGTVERVLAENERDEADHAYLIYALLNLELWLQTFVDRRGEEVTL